MNRFDGSVINHKSDTNGYWLAIIIELNGHSYNLLNVYGFNNRAKNKRMFSDLSSMIDSWKFLYSTEVINSINPLISELYFT